MIGIKTILDVFVPIFQFFSGIWEYFQNGVWDAYVDLQENIPILGKYYQWFYNLIADISGLDEWLNTFTLFEFTLGSGLILVIIITIIGWIGDKIGL